MIKAIFFDIDGTLVSFKTHTIPQSTIDAVSEVRKKGIKVFIATGRPMPFINNLGTLEYDGIMAVNGASFTTADGLLVFEKFVDKDDAERMLRYANDQDMAVAFATSDAAYVINPNDKFDAVFELLNLSRPAELGTEGLEGKKVMQVIAFFGEEEEKYILNNVLTNFKKYFRW